MAQGINFHNADSLPVDVTLTGDTFYPTAADATAATNAVTFPQVLTGDEDYYIPDHAGEVTITVSVKHNGREISGVDGIGETVIIGRGTMAQLGFTYDSLGSLAASATATNYRGKTNIVAASGAAATLVDLDTADVKFVTLSANCTLTFPAATEGDSMRLFLKQDATGSRTVTWPAGIKWPGSAAPTLTTTAAKTDSLRFIYVNAAWYGMVDGLSLG